jgi:hypothetical protein
MPPAVPPVRDVAAELRDITGLLSDVMARMAVLAEYATYVMMTPAPPAHHRTRKPKRIVCVSADVRRDRLRLWHRYLDRKRAEVEHPGYRPGVAEGIPLSKAFFAQLKHLNLREFMRWFAPRNGTPPGSDADKGIRQALQAEITRIDTLLA